MRPDLSPFRFAFAAMCFLAAVALASVATVLNIEVQDAKRKEPKGGCPTIWQLQRARVKPSSGSTGSAG